MCHKQSEVQNTDESILAGALVEIARFTNPLDENANQKLQKDVMRLGRLAPSLTIEGAEVGEGKYEPVKAFAVNLVVEAFGWNKGRCKDSLFDIPISETGISNL